jgi:hypothetical protein
VTGDTGDTGVTRRWTLALELGPDRGVRAGSKVALAEAVGRGADLRVYTEFLFEEHIQPGGGDPALDGLIREVIDFRETILVDGDHVGAITTQRQPLEPPFGFNGTEPRMSFFMYTGDGDQALAGLVLGGVDRGPAPGERTVIPTPADMPKMGEQEFWDVGTSGPSRNFVYDMETYRYFVRDDWEELLAADAEGRIERGSLDAIEAAQIAGRELKVGIRDLNTDLGDGPDHEVFSLLGSGFFHTGMRIYDALTHPLVRIAPAEPLIYRSFGWDVAWVHVRTDGAAVVRTLDPYSRRFSDRPARYAFRWFAR